MYRRYITIALIAGVIGLANAAEREGDKITQKPDIDDVKVAISDISARLTTGDPDDGEIQIKLDGRIQDIEKRIKEIEKELEFLIDNYAELVKSGKYEDYKIKFEEKLNSLCDSTRSYVSRVDFRTEQLIVKLEHKCRMREDQIAMIEEDADNLTKHQKNFKEELDATLVSAPEYVSLKTEYYKRQWKLRSLKAKSTALRMQNATERLAVSTYFNIKALDELKAEYIKQKSVLEKGG